MSEYLSREHLTHVVTILVASFVVYRVILFATSQLNRLADFESDPAVRSRRAQRANTLRSIVNNTVRIVMIVIVVMMVLREFVAVDVTPIVAGAGVIGIALGFGAQSLVRDYLSGALIIIENQFDIGDQVTVAGHTGTVELMTLRMTRLRDLDGGVHIIPNGKIETVVVLSREWARAIVDVTIDYREDLAKVLEAVETVATGYAEGASETIIGRPEVLGVDDLGPTGARVRITVKTRPGVQQGVARELRLRLKDEFDRVGIRLAGGGAELVTPGPEPPAS